MGKTLQIINTIIILGLLLISGILLLMKFPSSLDIAMELPATVFLGSFFGLFLIWSILIILSFFRTNINNGNYLGSAIMNIFLVVIGVLIATIFFILKTFSPDSLNFTAYGSSSAWVVAFIIEGSLFLFLVLSPIAFLISFIVFLVGYYKNKLINKLLEL